MNKSIMLIRFGGRPEKEEQVFSDFIISMINVSFSMTTEQPAS